MLRDNIVHDSWSILEALSRGVQAFLRSPRHFKSGKAMGTRLRLSVKHKEGARGFMGIGISRTIPRTPHLEATVLALHLSFSSAAKPAPFLEPPKPRHAVGRLGPDDLHTQALATRWVRRL